MAETMTMVLTGIRYTSNPTNARIQANLYMEVQPYEMTLTDTSDNDAEIAAHKGECCNARLLISTVKTGRISISAVLTS
jgi:uncharacterized membrane protein